MFIALDKIPMHRRRNITYGRICANFRPEKTDPNRSRLTIGGDRLNVPGDCGLWNTHRQHGHRQTSPQQRHLNQGCTLLHHRPQRFLPHDTNVTPRIHAHENQGPPRRVCRHVQPHCQSHHRWIHLHKNSKKECMAYHRRVFLHKSSWSNDSTNMATVRVPSLQASGDTTIDLYHSHFA